MQDYEAIEKIIKRKFAIQDRDVLPYCGVSTRRTLAELFGHLGYTFGAEIGVLNGDYSVCLLDSVPDLHLLCIDPWKEFLSQGQYVNQQKMELFYQGTVARLAGRNVEIVRKSSREAAVDIADKSLDFVYIDGDHEFDYVMTDIILFAPKVRCGGIVAGHDFAHWNRAGVVAAVEAYVRGHDIRPWYVTREQHPSWFWVQR